MSENLNEQQGEQPGTPAAAEPVASSEIDYEKLAAALAPHLAQPQAPTPVVPAEATAGPATAQDFGEELRSRLQPLPEEGHVAEPTLGVGMAGEAVHELARLAEACGVETYLRRGDNPRHVFTEELLRAVRQLVGDGRGFVSHVNADIWRALREKAAQSAQRAA